MSNPPFSQKCSVCGQSTGGDIVKHVRTAVHQEALQRALNSPLTNPDPRRHEGFKEGDRRKTTGTLGENNES